MKFNVAKSVSYLEKKQINKNIYIYEALIQIKLELKIFKLSLSYFFNIKDLNRLCNKR